MGCSQVGQIWDELLRQASPDGKDIPIWAEKLYHNSNRSYNVFRLDKIVTWVVEKAQEAQIQSGGGRSHLETMITNLTSAVGWVDIWLEVQKRQFDPEYKNFGLHFLHRWISEHSNSPAFQQHLIVVKAYLRFCSLDDDDALGLTPEQVQDIRSRLSGRNP